MNTPLDPVQTGYALAAAALRNDETGVRTLLNGITDADIRYVVSGALLGLAAGVRDVVDTDQLHGIQLTLQDLAATRALDI